MQVLTEPQRASRTGTGTLVLLEDPLCRKTFGWRIWYASADAVNVRMHKDGGALVVVLQERPVAIAAPLSATELRLGQHGLCTATHTNSPSLLRSAYPGAEVETVPRDGHWSHVAVEPGGLLMQSTAGLLEALPPKAMAGLPRLMAQSGSLAALAGDLVRRAINLPGGESAGVVIAASEPCAES